MSELKTIHQLVLLSIGGATGTLLRFAVYQWADQTLNKVLPWGTLIVNLTGSFVIGLVWGLFEKTGVPLAYRLFVFIGLLGSFTTFSTFAFDSYNLLHQNELRMLALNLLLQNAGGIVLCFTGIHLARFI